MRLSFAMIPQHTSAGAAIAFRDPFLAEASMQLGTGSLASLARLRDFERRRL